MDPNEVRNHRAFDTRWYYRLELAPGLYTPGQDRWTVTPTRALLRGVGVESGGADGGAAACLDIGIQEGLVMILLARRGASRVVGYDRVLRRSRLNLVQRALDTRFELIGGMKLQELPSGLAEVGSGPFDVVVFSGVMPQMFDPCGGLATARGLVREGGILLVETAAAFEDTDCIHFNRGRFTEHAIWFFTPRCLDYWLRYLRLIPLDVTYLTGKGEEPGKPAQGRIAVACRAASQPQPEPGDGWMAGGGYDPGFEDYLNWEALASDAPPVAYDGDGEQLVRRADGSVDLAASIEATDPLPRDREQTRLRLGATH